MIVYFSIFKIYVTLCLIGLFKKSIIQLKPTRQYPVPVVTPCVMTAEPVNLLACVYTDGDVEVVGFAAGNVSVGSKNFV